MKRCYGIELKTCERHGLEITERLTSYQPSVTILDVVNGMVVVEAVDEVEAVKKWAASSIIEVHPLVQISSWDPRFEDIQDYGFFSSKHEAIYLFLELVTGLTIEGGEDVQQEMFQLQLEENLIAIDQSPENAKGIFFVERDKAELVAGYARAYKMDIQFDKNLSLHLDK
ncbi:hypothetical protein [Halalkalibacterium ligniniphilum]|uniref:hypothetical protein n=1 Tax=Halalkalibacterium ligniniphilum TaxID=1134413 RepID=UPI00034B6D43|nr:hypothetical protein [Halalkalibacterium ligniniphilum]